MKPALQTRNGEPSSRRFGLEDEFELLLRAEFCFDLLERSDVHAERATGVFRVEFKWLVRFGCEFHGFV